VKEILIFYYEKIKGGEGKRGEIGMTSAIRERRIGF